MNKQLQTRSNNKKNNCIIPLFLTLTLMLTSMMGIAQTAYIANYNDNTVSVIDVAANTVIDTIKVGAHPYGVSVSLDGSKVYITNSSDGTVCVINTATNTVSATITVGANLAGISVTPDGSKVYVANSVYGTVSVINTATNTVSTTITVGGSPWGVCVSPDGNRVYVTGSYFQSVGIVNVINTATDTVSNNIYLDYNPYYSVSISPDGSKLYVANSFDNTISVINTASNTVSDTIRVGFEPIGISVSPDGGKVYVTGSVELPVYLKYPSTTNVGVATVINAAADTTLAIIYTVGSFSSGISFSPDGSDVYVVNSGDNIVSVINTANNEVMATIGVGNHPVAFGNFISTHKAVGIPTYSIDVASIFLYPNPAADQLIIHTSSFHNNEAVTISITNVLGEMMQEEKIKWSNDLSMNIKTLPAGIYFLQMKSESGIVVKRFIKE